MPLGLHAERASRKLKGNVSLVISIIIIPTSRSLKLSRNLGGRIEEDG
jgi:hypothetical protein